MTVAIAVAPTDGSGAVLLTDSMTVRQDGRGWPKMDLEGSKFDWLDSGVPFVYSGSIDQATVARQVQRTRCVCGPGASWRELALELWTGARRGRDGLGGPRKPMPSYLAVAGPDGVGLMGQSDDGSPLDEWPTPGAVVGGAVREWWLSSPLQNLDPPANLDMAWIWAIHVGLASIREGYARYGATRLEEFTNVGLIPPVAGPLHWVAVTSAGKVTRGELRL